MKVLLVGAGGYGTEYVKRLLVSNNPDITFVGIVDPYFATCPKREDIVNANIPVYDTMEDFFQSIQQTLQLSARLRFCIWSRAFVR